MKTKRIFQQEQIACHSHFPSIFSCLTPKEQEMFEEQKSVLTFQKGQPIFHEGNHPLGIFCVYIGKIKIEHCGEEGKMQIVRMAKAGDLIGYRALFCNEKYNANAVALEDSLICYFPKDIFFKVLENNNRLAMNFIKLLSTDLRHAENHLTEHTQKPVRERMAACLIYLIDTYGFEEDKATINILLSREEISDLVGTATETSIRLLSELKHENIIELNGRKIKVLDIQKLHKIANHYFTRL